MRIARIVAVMIIPQHFCDIGHAHRHSGMAAFRCLNSVSGKKANGVGKDTT
jgi:hypothetical protein